MAATLAVLCVVVHARCRLSSIEDEFLRKALRSKKSAVSGLFDAYGMTPLGVAAEIGCPSYLKDLVKVGCDINGLDMNHLTALCIASYHGELEVVSELVNLGAGTEVACGEDGVTALMCAARSGRYEVVERLLQAGARVNAQSRGGRTALYEAAMMNHVRVTGFLLEAGGDPNLFVETWGPPLCAAAAHGAIKCAKLLLRKGANLEERYNGSTALHVAAVVNSTGMVKVLVKAGAEVDAVDAKGRSALHLAAGQGNVAMVRYLKAAGSWLHTADNFGETILHFAVYAGNAQTVEEVLSWNAIDVSARGDMRATPLHVAAMRGFMKIAELLIAVGADVNAVMEGEPDGDGGTVLRVAAIRDTPELVELLLKAGAEVEASGEVLMEAARRGCVRAVKVLLGARDWPEEVKSTTRKLVGARADL
jgi:ankyrin repeat protein